MIILTKNHYYTILNDREEPSYKLQIHLKPPKCQLKVKAGERMVQWQSTVDNYHPDNPPPHEISPRTINPE